MISATHWRYLRYAGQSPLNVAVNTKTSRRNDILKITPAQGTNTDELVLSIRFTVLGDHPGSFPNDQTDCKGFDENMNTFHLGTSLCWNENLFRSLKFSRELNFVY